jgi:hypothetical protein
MSAILISVNGRESPVTPAHGPRFTLEELQALVGGTIEFIDLPDHKVMVLNEEGKMRGLPSNPAATLRMAGAGTMPSDYAVGDVVIVDAAQLS